MKKLAFLGSDELFEAVKNRVNADITRFSNAIEISGEFDLVALSGHTGSLGRKAINLHPSLLPAFEGEDSMKRAFLAGVKVSGVTVHWLDGKIIAQYPVLIGNLTHFDEFGAEIRRLELALYPVVIEKIINDEVFDFPDLLGGPISGCGGCGVCH